MCHRRLAKVNLKSETVGAEHLTSTVQGLNSKPADFLWYSGVMNQAHMNNVGVLIDCIFQSVFQRTHAIQYHFTMQTKIQIGYIPGEMLQKHDSKLKQQHKSPQTDQKKW